MTDPDFLELVREGLDLAVDLDRPDLIGNLVDRIDAALDPKPADQERRPQ